MQESARPTPDTHPSAEPAARLCCYCGNPAPGDLWFDAEHPLCSTCYGDPGDSDPGPTTAQIEAKLAGETAPAPCDPVAARRCDATAAALRQVAAEVLQDAVTAAVTSDTSSDSVPHQHVLASVLFELWWYVHRGAAPSLHAEGEADWAVVTRRAAARLAELLAPTWGEPGAEDAAAPVGKGEPCCRWHGAGGPAGPCIIATPAELQGALGRGEPLCGAAESVVERVLREAAETNPLHAFVEAHALAPIADDAGIVVRAIEVGSAAHAVGHPGGRIGGAS